MNRQGKVQDAPGAAGISVDPRPVTEDPAAVFTPPPEWLAADSAGVLWVPCEQVHLARVNLPLASPARRLKALPFALEPLLGEPLEGVHVALGPGIAGADFVAAAISRTALQRFADQAGKASKLVPDVFMLPIPEAGTWNVCEIGGRILVRTPDGAGFATSCAAFPAFYAAAECPQGQLLFGSPEGLPEMQTGPARPQIALGDLLDLRQGVFAAGGKAQNVPSALQLKIAAGVLAVFTLSLAGEAWTIRAEAARHRALLSAGLEAKYPALAETADPAAAIRRLSSDLSLSGDGGLIEVLSAAASALPPDGETALRTADFSAPDARLVLALEAGSVEGLYDYVRRLEAGGQVASVTTIEAVAGGVSGVVSVDVARGAP